MTGIPVSPNPSIPRDVDPQALRTALSVNKLVAMLPVDEVARDGIQGLDGPSVQQRAIEQLGAGATLNGQQPLPGSTRETLSAAARAILDLLDRTDAQPMRGTAPLLPTPPSGTATANVRAALAELVGQSGMFYESHLAEWVSGVRPLSALVKEPQALLGTRGAEATLAAALASRGHPAPQSAPRPVLLLPAPARTADIAAAADFAARQPSGAPRTADDTAIEGALVDAALADGAALDAASDKPSRPIPPAHPGNAPDPSAASTRPTPQTGPGTETPPRHATLNQQAAQAYQSVARDAERAGQFPARNTFHAGAPEAGQAATGLPAPTAAPVHPASEGLVRGQLELLASQQFRWAGEAWPGTPLDWQIERDRAHDDGAAANQPAGGWSTRLLLTLPNLGAVEARLTLTGTGLEARIVTPDGPTASQMNAARSELSGNLAANGLVLMRLAIETGTPAKPGDRP